MLPGVCPVRRRPGAVPDREDGNASLMVRINERNDHSCIVLRGATSPEDEPGAFHAAVESFRARRGSG